MEAFKSKSEIEKDLKSTEQKDYTFVQHEKGKSGVWEKFELIKYKNTIQNFARCIKCKQILSYSSKHGTASLLRHKCAGTSGRSSGNESMKKFILTALPCNRKEKIISKQLYFVVKDLRPLNVTEGEGFLDFAQDLVNLGAEYGRHKIENILASRRTLTRSVLPKKYDELKRQVTDLLKENFPAFTTDLWTDEYTQRSFLTLTSHVITQSYELKTFVLGTRQFLDKKTGQNIHDFVISILKEYQLENKLAKSVTVTDNGPNVVLAFRPYTRLSCACHTLNLVMHDVLENNDKIPELKTTINETKKLVAYMKHSELNNKLPKSVKQHVITRWNSIFIMLKSIRDVYNDIRDILITKDEINRLGSLNFAVINSLVEFLNLFKECSENLSADLRPTLNEFVLWERKLVKHCAPKPEDSHLIKELKKQTLNCLQKRFIPQDLHYVALFLDPKFKTLKFLNDVRRDNIYQAVSDMLQSIADEPNDNCVITATTSEEDVPTKRLKVSRGSVSFFEEFVDSSGEEENNDATNEIQTYIKKKISPETEPLKFWKSAIDLPLLRQLARRILNIPASSSSSERVFSKSGRILEERRTRLSSDNVDKILFLNKNLNV